MAAAKRPRASSSSSSSLATNPELSQTTTSTDRPPPKASRIHPSATKSLALATTPTTADNTRHSHPILCNLPPTCQNRPTPIQSTIELERHYAKFHAHVCEFNNCGCVFPEERFLELHQTECHDPIAALRKDRNEKIFECHIPAPTCGRKFSSPKTRRLHLIQAHNYPKQYFFAVTNKGIGGLLKKWGEGASLIRKEWKPRQEGLRDQMMMMDEDGDEEEDEEDSSYGLDPIRKDGQSITDDDNREPADLDATPRIRPRRMLSPTAISQASSSFKGSSDNSKSKYPDARANSQQNPDIAGLTQSLNSLSLVPNSVRFGRGGKTRGFASGGLVKGNSNHTAGTGIRRSASIEVDVGRGGRGRGSRGRGFRGRGF